MSLYTAPHTVRLSQFLAAHPRWADVIACLAGIALVLAFAPFAWRPMAVLAPAVLFGLWALAPTARQALRRGLWFGLGQFGLGVSWVYFSIHDFGEAPPVLAGLITLLLVVCLALFLALLGWGLYRLRSRRRLGLYLVVALPAGWVLAEWVRNWLLTGFPWLLLGHTQVDTWLNGLAPLAGTFGLSLVVALLAGLTAWLVLTSEWRLRLVLVMLAAVILLGGLGARQFTWSQPAGNAMDVALVQGNIPQALKWQPEHREPFFRRYQRLTTEHLGADLILWPESALPAFYHEAREAFLVPLATQVQSAGGRLITGVLVYDFDRQQMYNALLAPAADGQDGLYYKRHLVPFGEYVPFGLLDTLEQFLTVTAFNTSPGRGRNLLKVNGSVIGASICYEVVFGEEIVEALPAAELLVNVSNDAWFGGSIGPKQHFEIARMRSLETARPLLRATNNGITAVVAANGQVQARLPQFTIDVLRAQVQPRTGITPYAWWGNYPVVLLALMLLTVAWWWRRADSHADSFSR